MKRTWNKIKAYYLTHDGIEMLLFACIWGSFGFIAYHVVVGIADKLLGV